MCTLKRTLQFIAVLDFIGGFLGTYTCSVLLDAFWHLDHVEFPTSSTTYSPTKKDVTTSNNLAYDLKVNRNGPAIWVAADETLFQIFSFRVGRGDNYGFTLTIVIFTCAVISAMHILFASILLAGTAKSYAICIKCWMVFKITAVVLTFIGAVVLVIRANASLLLLVFCVLFIVPNLVFICLVARFKASLGMGTQAETGAKVAGDWGNFTLEEAAAPYGLLEKFVQLIEEKGLATSGLYIDPGSSRDVEAIVDKVLKNPRKDFKGYIDYLSIKVVATAFQQIVSQRITPPIIPTDKLEELYQIGQIPVSGPERSQQLKEFLVNLPPPNFTILKILIGHLVKIALQPRNQLNSTNLAISWGPAIFPVTAMAKLREQRRELDPAPFFRDLVMLMIDHYPYFFCGQEALVVPGGAWART